MFVDERIYTLHAGQVPVFLKLYEEEAMECQVQVLGKMVGYYFTDIGPLSPGTSACSQAARLASFNCSSARTSPGLSIFIEMLLVLP